MKRKKEIMKSKERNTGSERNQKTKRLQGDVMSREVQARVQRLRSYAWSSLRAYLGTVKAPEWLTTEAVLELGEKQQMVGGGVGSMAKRPSDRACRPILGIT